MGLKGQHSYEARRMNTSNDWQILGIPASSDERAIKRAYAARLKVTNPEDDPAGFKRLRNAYESALLKAKSRASRVPMQEDFITSPDDDAPLGAANLPTTDHQANPDLGSAQERRVFDDWVEASPPPAPAATALQLHQTRLEHLAILIHDEEKMAEAEAVLEEILNGTAIEELSIHSDTEEFLIALLEETYPMSMPIMARCMTYFGWSKPQNLTPYSPGYRAAELKRTVEDSEEAKAFIEETKSKKHEYHRAYLEASVDPDTRSWFSRTWGLTRLKNVEAFFDEIEVRFPSAFRLLNGNAVAWLSFRVANVLPNFKYLRWLGIVLGIVVALNVMDQVSRSDGILSDVAFMRMQVEREPENVEVSRRLCLASVKIAAVRSSQEDRFSLLGVKDQARTDCLHAVSLRPNSIVLRTHLGIGSLKIRDFQLAQESFNNVLAVSPANQSALFGMGLALKGMGRPHQEWVHYTNQALMHGYSSYNLFKDFGFDVSDIPAPRNKPPKKGCRSDRSR